MAHLLTVSKHLLCSPVTATWACLHLEEYSPWSCALGPLYQEAKITKINEDGSLHLRSFLPSDS